MRHCTTLALLLSLSACEHASQATSPSTPDPAPQPHAAPAPAPTPRPAISAEPAPAKATEAKKPLPKVPCRARVCPEWDRTPASEEAAAPLEVRPLGTMRATPWQGQTPKVRVKRLPEAGK